MKQKIEGRSGAVDSKLIVIIVALIMVVAAVSVIFVIGLPDNNDNEDDSESHKHIGIGSTMTYDAIEGKSMLTTFDLTVVGTNTYNYALDVSPISAAFGLDTKYQVFHIDTGELVFALKEDVCTATIGGETTDLKSYEITDDKELKWTFYLRADLESMIPVMIECEKSAVKIKAELRSFDIEHTDEDSHGDASFSYSSSGGSTVKAGLRTQTSTSSSNVMMIGDDTLKVYRTSVTVTNESTGEVISSYSTVSYSLDKL